MKRILMIVCVLAALNLALSIRVISQTPTLLFGLASGAAKPVSIDSNGAMNIALASGSSPFTILAGGGVNSIGFCGVLDSTTTDFTPATTGEETAWSVTVPANTLNAADKSLVWSIGWTTAGNGNTKLLKTYVDATALNQASTAANANGMLSYGSLLYLTGTTDESTVGTFAAGSVVETRYVNANATWTGAVTFTAKLTNVTTATDSVFRWGRLLYCPAAPQ